MIVYGNGPHTALREYLEAKIGDTVCKDAQFIGRLDDKENVIASCAFSSYTGKDGDVEISVAADPGAGTPGLVGCIFAYIFTQLECARATARIRDDNWRSQKLARRLGFKLEGRLRKATRGHDLLIYGILRDEYGEFTKSSKAGRSKHHYSGAGASQPRQPHNTVRVTDLRRQGKPDDDAAAGNAERL